MNRAITFASIAGLLIASVAIFLVIQSLTPSWVGPGLNIVNAESAGVGSRDCWLVKDISWPRQRTRGDEVLETRDSHWHEIYVLERPSGNRIAHDQAGLINVGDVACTTRTSQEWYHRDDDAPLWKHCNAQEWSAC